MKQRFFDLSLPNKSLRSYVASRQESITVAKVILGIGVPSSLLAVTFMYFGMASFPALISQWHWGVTALIIGELSGFALLFSLALFVTHRELRRRLPR